MLWDGDLTKRNSRIVLHPGGLDFQAVKSLNVLAVSSPHPRPQTLGSFRTNTVIPATGQRAAPQRHVGYHITFHRRHSEHRQSSHPWLRLLIEQPDLRIMKTEKVVNSYFSAFTTTGIHTTYAQGNLLTDTKNYTLYPVILYGNIYDCSNT